MLIKRINNLRINLTILIGNYHLKFKQMKTESRWKLVQNSCNNDYFLVIDKQLKREYRYCVPLLDDIKLKGDFLYASTISGKLMQINLKTGMRKFLLDREVFNFT